MVSVETSPQGDPSRVTLRGCSQRVRRVLDRYRYGGRWWRGEGERRYYLVELEEGLVAEVYRTVDVWVLSCAAD